MLLEVNNLNIKFKDTLTGDSAVKDISFSIGESQIVGIVGESGSGKSVTALSLCGLSNKDKADISGSILFKGDDILKMDEGSLCKIRGRDIGVVFQEPTVSMNPLLRVGVQIEEPLKLHTKLKRQERYKKAIEALKSVKIKNPEEVYKKYPHELSGGMLQRCMIASAIINSPALLIADEPTTALDVTTQSQIIDLLKEYNRQSGSAIIFISHDLNVIRQLCETVIVMKRGVIKEVGKVSDIFNSPKDEYTKQLIASIPTRERTNTDERTDS